MSRICLLVPTNKFDQYFIQVPLDVAYAAGQLRAEDHEVVVWDQRLSPPPDGPKPDVLVLFTAIADRAQCYPLDLVPVRAALDRAREVFPDAVTVAVGPHGNHLPHATRADLAVDHVALGEADSAAVHAVRDLGTAPRHSLPPVLPAGASRATNLLDTATSATTPPHYPNIPLDEFAPAAFDLLPMTEYTSEIVTGGLPQPGPCGMTLAARGCTYGCTFCHLPFGTRMRTQPVDRALAEIEAQRRTGLSAMFFLDYVFGINPKFYNEICDRLTGAGMTFTGQTRAEIVLRNDVRRWADAGCTGMWLGAESPTVAGTGVHKRVTAGQIEDAVGKLSDAGIVPFAFILMGLPDDEASTSGTLVDWVASLPAWFGINQLYLRPGTSLYDSLAPRYNGGTAPATWAEVEAVTHTYRLRYPADLDAQEAALRALPNFLGNALVPTA